VVTVFPATVAGGGTVQLPTAASQKLLTLSAVLTLSTGGHDVTPIGRSYAGNPWELTTGSLPAVSSAAAAAEHPAPVSSSATGVSVSTEHSLNGFAVGGTGAIGGQWEYSTMDFCAPTAAFGACPKNCQDVPVAMPAGWMLAPFNSDGLNLLKTYSFGTHVVVFGNGDAYGTRGFMPGQKYGHGLLVKSASGYQPRGCSMKVLIARGPPTPSPTPSPTSSPTPAPTERIVLSFAATSASDASETAAQAVDGDTSTRFQSQAEYNPWWQGELASSEPIGPVEITLRSGNCGARMFHDSPLCAEFNNANHTGAYMGAIVGVSDIACTAGAVCPGTQCARLTYAQSSGNLVYTINCHGKSGKYVYIQLPTNPAQESSQKRRMDFVEITVDKYQPMSDPDRRLWARVDSKDSDPEHSSSILQKPEQRPIRQLSAAVPNATAQFDCSAGGSCTIVLPSGDGRIFYRVDEYATAVDTSSDAAKSRFLMQASFGPNRAAMAEITSATTAGFQVWIDAQMALPMTSHRAYYRQRANPRLLHNRTWLGGAIRKPCSAGSRWREYTFTLEDENTKLFDSNVPGTVLARANAATGMVELVINDEVRSEVESFTSTTGTALLGSFTMCFVHEGIGEYLAIGDSALGASACSTENKIEVAGGNPKINFTAPGPLTAQSVLASEVTFRNITKDLERGSHILESIAFCPFDSSTYDTLLPSLYLVVGTGIYRLDNRLAMMNNTLSSPAVVTGSSGCATAAKTFLNRKHCQRLATCSTKYKSTPIPLNTTVLRSWFTRSSKYVYAIRGLRLEGSYQQSPCQSGYTSRWQKGSTAGCTATVGVDSGTIATIESAIRSGGAVDTNAYVRDIPVATTAGTCHSSSTLPSVTGVGIQLPVDGTCWQHVHPHEYNVIDASYWATLHPGGLTQVTKFAETLSSTTLTFPASHTMERYSANSKRLTTLGRFGDVVDFADLPSVVQTSGMADDLGAGAESVSDGFTACGSPDEVANSPRLGAKFPIRYDTWNPAGVKLRGANGIFKPLANGREKSAVWTSVSLTAADQLRQRVAWALIQIFVIGHGGVKIRLYSEAWHVYYDALLRNAFGNYRDLLKEVSYSPMMGEYLTYAENTARYISGSAADENYSREIMQLFSIGLWRLNDDGTFVTDAAGNRLETYDNEDIMSFARAWTGFDKSPARGNHEVSTSSNSNFVDPMRIRERNRDPFPKRDLYGGFIGDTYPLCSDAPPRSFLRAGALYRNLGGSPSPEGFTDVPASGGFTAKRFTADPASALWASLCGGTAAGGACLFPAEVALDANVPCHGAQCNIDTLRVVRVLSGNATVWYEYVPAACVELTFYPNATKVKRANALEFCADPNTASAGAACQMGEASTCYLTCAYRGERVTKQAAKERCAAVPAYPEQCTDFWGSDTYLSITPVGGSEGCDTSRQLTYYQWLDSPCTLKAQIASDGYVSIVHGIHIEHENTAASSDKLTRAFKLDNGNYFPVKWEGDAFPAAASSTCAGACVAHGLTCVCNVTVDTAAVFTDESAMPTAAEAQAALKIGAPHIGVYGAGTYARCTTSACTSKAGLEVWFGPSGRLDDSSVFKVTVSRTGQVLQLRNFASLVKVGSAGSFSFRNPPHFMSFTEPTLRDAEYETEAVLDHYAYHPNVPPFMAQRMIQRFTSSNPSPRYVKAAATAFKEGAHGGKVYSGKYGDMGAMMAAILLDREARSVELEADPHAGGVREPILKVVHTLRAFEAEGRLGQEIELADLTSKLGQHPYMSGSVSLDCVK
jgi:cullin-associated NEDD8-dissociated protein 1